jgi:hypothetical protein
VFARTEEERATLGHDSKSLDGDLKLEPPEYTNDFHLPSMLLYANHLIKVGIYKKWNSCNSSKQTSTT